MTASTAPAPHAAAMDRMYRYTRHIYDLTRKPYLLGRDQLIEDLQPPAGARILEMGCGTGRNLIAVARRYPEVELYGFDISAEMLKTARAAVERAGLSARIHLAEGDATDFDAVAAFGIDTFDRVYISYALSMIPPWQAALARGLALTRAGGRLSTVDFGFCDEIGPLARRPLHAWLNLFHVTPRRELETEIRRLAEAAGRPWTFRSLHRGYAQLASIG